VINIVRRVVYLMNYSHLQRKDIEIGFNSFSCKVVLCTIIMIQKKKTHTKINMKIEI